MLDLLQPTNSRRTRSVDDDHVPLLEPGDQLDQVTFHARYAAMPEGPKVELIEGVVYMPALRRTHGRATSLLVYWLRAYDLHSKKRDYERAGVREYLVVALRQHRVFWFVNQDGKFEERTPDAEGIHRSQVFPGLWLAPEAMVELDGRRVLEVLRQGLSAPSHGAFVAQLAARRKGLPESRQGGSS